MTELLAKDPNAACTTVIYREDEIIKILRLLSLHKSYDQTDTSLIQAIDNDKIKVAHFLISIGCDLNKERSGWQSDYQID